MLGLLKGKRTRTMFFYIINMMLFYHNFQQTLFEIVGNIRIFWILTKNIKSKVVAGRLCDHNGFKFLNKFNIYYEKYFNSSCHWYLDISVLFWSQQCLHNVCKLFYKTQIKEIRKNGSDCKSSVKVTLPIWLWKQ